MRRRIFYRRILAVAIVTFALLSAPILAAGPMPDSTRARYDAAVAAIDAGEPAVAETALREIVGRHPNPDLARGYRPYFQLARACLQLGELEDAELSLAISEGLLPHKPRKQIRRSVEQLRIELEKAVR